MQPFCWLFLGEDDWPRAGTIPPSARTSPLSLMPSKVLSFLCTQGCAAFQKIRCASLPPGAMNASEQVCFRGFDVSLRGVKFQVES
jgi:hypothetical protein